jgi:peptidoglycan/LPS O-acetylase OafA/YrhL
LQGIALLPIFTAAILLPRWWLFSPLNMRWSLALGRVSYPFYLVHLTVTEWVMHAIPTNNALVKDVLAFAASVAIATAIYRFVETPFAAIRKRLAAH